MNRQQGLVYFIGVGVVGALIGIGVVCRSLCFNWDGSGICGVRHCWYVG